MISNTGYFTSKDVHFLTSAHNKPTFVIDLEMLRENVREFRRAFGDMDLYYSVKTNPELAIIDTLSDMGLGYDAATIPEIRLLVARGVEPGKIIFTHPVKSIVEIQEAYTYGVYAFTLDTLDELKRLEQYAPNARYMLRIAPRSNASLYDYKNKFGASEEELKSILNHAVKKQLNLIGISFMVGSQSLSVQPWKDTLDYVKEIVDAYYDTLPALRVVNIGSGFPVPYAFGDIPELDKIADVVKDFKAQIPADMKIVAEPGRIIVASAAILSTRVVQKVVKGGQNWLYTDANVYSGLIEIVESGGRFTYPISASRSGKDIPYMIAGKTLDPDDIIGKNILLSDRLESGDTLYIHDVGAYSTSFFTNYHSLEQPSVIFVDSQHSDNVELGTGDMHITGLQAKRNIDKGELVFVVSGYFNKERTRTTFQVDTNLHVEPTAFGAFLNHSCEPNVGIQTNEHGFHNVIAMRDIKKGEDVAADYAMFEYETGPMAHVECLCGSKQCRKFITGYKDLPEELRQRYAGYTARYLTANY